MGYASWVYSVMNDESKMNTKSYKYAICEMSAITAASDALAKYTGMCCPLDSGIVFIMIFIKGVFSNRTSTPVRLIQVKSIYCKMTVHNISNIYSKTWSKKLVLETRAYNNLAISYLRIPTNFCY